MIKELILSGVAQSASVVNTPATVIHDRVKRPGPTSISGTRHPFGGSECHRPVDARESSAVKAEIMAIIELSGVSKSYSARKVLEDINLRVEAGEIFGVMGPNGAGKTTLVEIVEGLRAPDAGVVRVLGMDPRADRRRLNESLGVQLQHTQLPDNLKVWEALHLFASFYRSPTDWSALMDTWGLTTLRAARIGKLSGGQKQRLYIALALIGDPELVILDELTTGLDPAARRETLSLVNRIRDAGVTVVLISHFMEEIEALCDRVAVLAGGRLVAIDTPAALADRVAAATLDDAFEKLVGLALDS